MKGKKLTTFRSIDQTYIIQQVGSGTSGYRIARLRNDRKEDDNGVFSQALQQMNPSALVTDQHKGSPSRSPVSGIMSMRLAPLPREVRVSL